MRKNILSLFLLFYLLNSFSQKKYNQVFSIINDNDLFVSTHQDRYYTNGLFLSYSYLGNQKSDSITKKIYTIQIGQRLYSPFKANVQGIDEHDRPFAGYLYTGFGFKNYHAKNYSLGLSAEIGILGPSAAGEPLMNFVHNIYGFEPAHGWKYQIKDAFALNFKGEFLKEVSTLSNKYFDFNWKNEANVGTIFTDISTGFLSRIGIKPLQKNNNSVAFNSNLNNSKSGFNNEKEIFFYINPMLRYAIYDATIQGSFLNNTSPITYELNPIVFTTEIGFWLTTNRFNFKYMVSLHTKKLKSFKVPGINFYGGIQINYLFN